MHHGPQHAPASRDNFGVFLDSSPDRWGRVLLRAKEIVGEVKSVVRTWRTEAKRVDIARAEQNRMATAFRLADDGA